MMRKFPKLLAVVLAVAIVICPAVCLTSMAADPTGTYGMAAEIVSGETYDTATLNIAAGADSQGFVAAVAKIAVEGYDLYEGTESDPVDAVTATDLKADGDALNLGVQYNYNSTDKVLTVVVMDKDNTTLNFIASATVSIKVCNPVSGNHTLTLTHIQASDAGTYNAETGKFEGNESLFTFPNADNNASGLIDQALATGTVAGVSCAHTNATYVDDPLQTCTADGTRTWTCSECGHTWTEVLPAEEHSTTGGYGSNADNHWEICENCDDHVNEAAHVFGNDNTCDVCGYTRVCTHSWDEGTVTTEATCTEDGVKTYTCTICGETKTEAITAPGHSYNYTSNSDGTHNAVCANDANHTITNEACSYVDGVCEFCGYEQPAEGPLAVDTEFKHNMTLANSTRVNIYIVKNDQWNSCASIEAVVTREDYKTGTNVPKVSTITFSSYNSTLYRAEYGDFLSYQYGDVFTAHILGKDAEGNVIYESANDDVFCVKAYCALQFQNESAKEATKIVCADLLKFGAKAQDFFGNYRTASGEYADKDDARYTVEQYIESYATKTNPVLTKTIDDSDATGLVKVYSSLTCGSSIDFNMICLKSAVTDYDINNLRYVMTYKNYKNVDKTFEVTGDKFDGTKGTKYWYAVCNELYVADFSSDLTVKLYDGDTLISNTRLCSVEAYAKQMIEKNGATQVQIDFYNAMMNYSKSAANI